MSYFPELTTGLVSFTPVVADGGTGAFTYNTGTRVGTVLKTERTVFFNINIEWTAKDAGTTAVTISGIPYGAIASGSGPIIVFAYGVTTSNAFLYGVVQTTGVINLYVGGSTSTDPALLGSALAAAGGIKITGSYLAATY